MTHYCLPYRKRSFNAAELWVNMATLAFVLDICSLCSELMEINGNCHFSIFLTPRSQYKFGLSEKYKIISEWPNSRLQSPFGWIGDEDILK